MVPDEIALPTTAGDGNCTVPIPVSSGRPGYRNIWVLLIKPQWGAKYFTSFQEQEPFSAFHSVLGG